MDAEILIPIAGIFSIPMIIGVVSVSRQVARKREYEHQERMKRIEMGLPMPGEGAWSGRSAIALGAVMPIAVFTLTWLATVTHAAEDEIWIAAAAVGVTGVVGGVKIANSKKLETPEAFPDSAARNGHRKPRFDPEAYDEIVRR